MSRFRFGGSPADIVLLTTGDQLNFAPNSTITLWDDDIGGNQLMVSRGEGLPDQATITTDAFGRIPVFYGPEGIAKVWAETPAGERQLLTSTSLSAEIANKLGRDELPVQHTHVPAELAAAQARAAQTTRLVRFDTVTDTWPYQGDVTATSPAVPVFWIGDATVPAQARWGLDYIDTLGQDSTNIPDPTPDPTPDPDPVLGIAMSTPVQTVTGASVSLSANLSVTNGSQTFSSVVISVRGPAGQHNDVGLRSNVTVNSAVSGGVLSLSGSFTAPASGSWQAYVSYNISGGANTWVDGPKRTFTVTIPSGGGGSPAGIFNAHASAGGSGKPWNSGAFVDGNGYAQWDKAGQTWFGTYRGAPSDVWLVFNDGASDWGSHDTFYWGNSTNWSRIFVWTIPPQPKFAGGNSSTANGSNNSHWAAIGQTLLSNGWNSNRMVIRLGHESNGNWYPWSWGTGGNAQTFIDAYKNCVTQVRAKAPNVLFNICLNKDWTGEGGKSWTQVLDALKDYIDIVGLDAYDLYSGFRNDQGRKTAWYNNSGPQRNSVAAWCRANGKMISLDEWGLISTSGADGTGGGDDVLYISDTYAWCYANRDILAYESYFMAPGNPGYNHELNNGSYANAQTEYKKSSRFGGF